MANTSVTPDKRRIKGQETRAQLLQSAISCIATGGLSGTTLDRIAEHAGVSRALVVFHFKSKNRLIEAALNHLGEFYSAGWDGVVANNSGSAMQKVIRLADYDIRFACENPVYLSAWHAFWGEAKGNQLYAKIAAPRDQKYAGDIERLLSEVIDHGNYDKDELPDIINSLSALLFGLWHNIHLDTRADNYATGMAAIRLFLSKCFPHDEVPKELNNLEQSISPTRE
jgi:AcrR family transcriptional regulator